MSFKLFSIVQASIAYIKQIAVKLSNLAIAF
jgi:hypothetical protein